MITKVTVRDESNYVSPDGGRCPRYIVAYLLDGKPTRLVETFRTRKDARAAAARVRGRGQ